MHTRTLSTGAETTYCARILDRDGHLTPCEGPAGHTGPCSGDPADRSMWLHGTQYVRNTPNTVTSPTPSRLAHLEQHAGRLRTLATALNRPSEPLAALHRTARTLLRGHR